MTAIRFIMTGIVLLSCTYIHGQVGQTLLFPGLQGPGLVQALRSQYKTSIVLDYSVARDTLFLKVDAKKDSLECIYTGMKKFLTPGADPTEAVYMDGLPNGINTEHSWPQSKGASGLALSDMHHLFPSRVKTNSDRGDLIMGEIPDNETKIWYLGTTERIGAPAAMRDLYSELAQGKFEPRESVKGNIARALFYFYTMYKEQADAADPNYFSAMKSDLCEWHYLDPVDSLEWMRNKKIATYQGGKENPFILDCSLVSRAYCNNIDQACEAALVSEIQEIKDNDKPALETFPNPSSDILNIQGYGIKDDQVNILVTDAAGIQKIYKIEDIESGFLQSVIQTSTWPDGMYIINVTGAQGLFHFSEKIFITR